MTGPSGVRLWPVWTNPSLTAIRWDGLSTNSMTISTGRSGRSRSARCACHSSRCAATIPVHHGSVDLVLLHPFPVDSRLWDGARDQLGEHSRLITPDQRGLGATPLDLGGAVPEPDLDAVARDVLHAVDDLGVDRFVLGGCSMGGYVAMAVLRIASERVAGLVLADTRADADTAEARERRLAMAERVESDGVGDWLPDATLPTLLGENASPEVTASVRRMVLDQPATGIAWAQRAMAARLDSRELLAGTDVPTLVVVGSEDVLTPPPLAREMACLLPNATLREVPGAGHLSPAEAPEAFSRAVLDWLPAVSR
jgi:pimeloyl-ACP methyl ester carboxylesterase